jgi:hypothetical protein
LEAFIVCSGHSCGIHREANKTTRNVVRIVGNLACKYLNGVLLEYKSRLILLLQPAQHTTVLKYEPI